MTSCHLWMQSDTCTCGPCHAAHFLGHHSSLPLCTPATPNAGGSSVTMVVPASTPGCQTPAISLLSDADLVFSPFFGRGGGEVTHFVLFTSSTSNNQLCLLKCLFELILLPPADRELTGRMPASPTASSSSMGFTPSALSSWFPEPWEACLPGPAVSAAPPLCALCVLHKGRPGAPGRQGSCSPVSVPCTAGLGDSINVCCTYIQIIKKVNSCCQPR